MTDLTEARSRLDVMLDEIRDLRAERDSMKSLLEYLLPWVRLHSKAKAQYIERALAGGKASNLPLSPDSDELPAGFFHGPGLPKRIEE